MFQQLERGGAEQQVAPAPLSRAAGAVDQATEHGKKIGPPVDLIEDDKLVLVALQTKLRLGEPGKVSFRLEVKVEGRARSCQLERQSGLARLSGTEQGYGGEAVEAVLELREDPPFDHPCKLST